MSKPEDISQDDWDTACGFLPDLKGRPAPMPEEVAAVIAHAILAAKAECLPKLGNTGKYLAQDNTGQWHYINHAGTWQTCPPPFPSVEEEREACAQVAVDLAAGRLRQSLAAKEAKKRPEARDFESMSMSATDVAFAIRKRGEG